MTNRTCTLDDCDAPLRCKGLCKGHYSRMLATGSPYPRPRNRDLTCIADDCTDRVYALKACRKHWQRIRQFGQLELPPRPPRAIKICSYDGCPKVVKSRDLCGTHYQRWRVHGDPSTLLTRPRTGIRTCFRCLRTPDEVQFKADKRAPDGLGAYCRPCQLEYGRARYLADPASHNAKTLARYYANRDYYLEQHRRYRLANLDRIRAYDRARRRGDPRALERARQYRLQHPEEVRAYLAAWYQANKDKHREACRNWRRRNPNAVLANATRRRMRMRGGNEAIEVIDREAVWLRDHGLCGLCAEPVAFDLMHVDHIKPLAKGGPHTFNNVQSSHPRCNLRKKDREVPKWAFARNGHPLAPVPRRTVRAA